MVEVNTLDMKFQFPAVECLVSFLSTALGGRARPPHLNGGQYRPLLQLVGIDSSELFGVMFQVGPSEMEFSSEVVVELTPIIYPNSAYDALQLDAQFIIREGHKVVGIGRVIRCKSSLAPAR